MKKDTKKIAVFFGGCSSEYEVSLQSAHAVMQAVDTSKYTLIPVGIDRSNGKWFLYHGSYDQIPSDRWQSEEICTPVFPSMDRNLHGLCYLKQGGLETIALDGALPILHGKNGEDGTLQGTLKLMGVPLIGCGLLSSALCMDKELAHHLVEMHGIKTARSVSVTADTPKPSLLEAGTKLGYPLFVKPVCSGSSFGITKAVREEDLIPAVKEALLHDSRVILEETIDGIEVGCAVLGTDQLFIGEVDEIELSEGFFDYTEKYTLKSSKIHVPARVSSHTASRIKETAGRIYHILGCCDFARVDLFLTSDGTLYFNEVNTIPGFTAHSRYPNMLKASGLTFEQIIDRLLEHALETQTDTPAGRDAYAQ